MNVTLDQLRAFERVVRLGSFHAAAEDLHLAQPSISARVKELESALNVQLFVRQGPRIRLTAEGHALIELADRTLGSAGELVERFRTRDPLRGLLRLGMNESFALVSATDLIERIERHYPALRTSIFVGDTGAVSQMLAGEQLDVAIVSEAHVPGHVKQEVIGKNRFGWFAHAGFPVTREVMSPSDLGSLHLLISPPTARLHETVLKWFADARVTPERVSTCNSLPVTVQAVVKGLGVALVPVRIIQSEVDAHRVRQLVVAPEVPAHSVSICYQASEFGPGIKRLADLIRELIAHHELF
jgi:DNA-binding transcriptional LysR family regulator